MKKIICIVLLTSMWVMMYGTTAAKGVFTVAAGKTVQFADAPETELVQWSTANAWSEAHATVHGGWHVLNHEEWTYLLADGRTNAADLNNLGTVDSQKGLIILPDGFVQPVSAPTFKPVGQGIAYNNNEYTAEQWALMADAGAIFLPCQGYKEGETIKEADIHGAYWSSDPCSATNGYSVHFNEGEIHNQNTFASKDLYYSIILVRDSRITELDEQDYSAAFATKLAAADDYDFAYVRRTLKKDSTLYTLCLPFDVPNIDASPLAGAEVFEFLGGRVSGTTGNERLFLQLSRLNGKRLTQGVPYLLRWAKTDPVETMESLYFAHVENWDTNTTAADDPGNETIKLRGVYPKAHIPGYTSGSVAHYNFFMGANNTLYWPDDNLYLTHDMKGFRAYFYIIPPAPDPADAPRYRNMPVVWQIGDGLSSPTDTGYWTLDNGHCKKQLRNGQIILVIDGKEYDLQGKVIGN